MTSDAQDDRAGVMRASDRTPSPDPTVLTSAALYREVAGLEQRMDERFKALELRMVNNFEAFEKSLDLLNRERLEQFVSIRELMETRIRALGDLMEEKFIAAERQRVEQKKDTKDAVDAALSAAKEAVKEQTTASERSIAKSETATTKQLEQQQLTTATAVSDLRRSIDELKERLSDEVRVLRTAVTDVGSVANGGIQRGVGAREDRTGLYATVGMLVAVVIAVIAVVGLVLAEAKP